VPLCVSRCNTTMCVASDSKPGKLFAELFPVVTKGAIRVSEFLWQVLNAVGPCFARKHGKYICKQIYKS
jgi:hypothetical protein